MVRIGLIILISFAFFISFSLQKKNQPVPNPLDSNKNVLILDQENFNQVRDSHDFLLVYFYVPHSDRCEAFNGIFNEAYKNLVESEKLNITFARVDGMHNSDLAEKYEVIKYPTVILYRKLGNDHTHLKGKKKNLDNLLNFVKNEASSDYEWNEVKNQEELEKMMNDRNIVLFVGDKVQYKNELIVTKRAVESLGKKFRLIITNAAEFRTKYSLSQEKPELVFFKQHIIRKPLKKQIETLIIDLKLVVQFTTKSLANLIKSYDRKPLALLNERLSEKILAGQINSLIIFLDKSQNATNSNLIAGLKGFAEKNRAFVWVVIGNYGDKEINELMELVNISKTELPTAVLVSGINKKTDIINRYKFNTSERGPLSEESLNSFIADWRDNKLVKILQSDPLPVEAVNKQGVHLLVGNNLNEFVKKININGAALVLFTNKEMPNFKEIRDRFYNISQHLSNHNFLFGEIDPYKNEVELITMTNYPGIAIIKKLEDKIDVKEYDHPTFKSNEMLNFIKNETNIDVFTYIPEVDRLVYEKENDLKIEDHEADVGEILKSVGIDDNTHNEMQEGDEAHEHENEHEHEHENDHEHEHEHEHEDL